MISLRFQLVTKTAFGLSRETTRSRLSSTFGENDRRDISEPKFSLRNWDIVSSVVWFQICIKTEKWSFDGIDSLEATNGWNGWVAILK